MGIAGLWLVACGGPAHVQYEEQLEQSSVSAAHAVHGERLAELMRSLDRLRNERLPKALDVTEEEARRSREIMRVARAMADSAAGISAATPTGLDERERDAFGALALELQQRVERLVDDAPALSLEERRERLAEIDATCNACHRQFRIPGRGDDRS